MLAAMMDYSDHDSPEFGFNTVFRVDAPYMLSVEQQKKLGYVQDVLILASEHQEALSYLAE